MHTKIFLDSGDPKETEEILGLIGHLDGQTTNPSLIAKNPEAQQRLDSGKLFTSKEVSDFYKEIIQKIADTLPKESSVSIEVYGDGDTKADQMVTQATEMYSWIPNAHIKLPTTLAGIEAAHILTNKGIRVNMTLVFSQQQAAAVYEATSAAKAGDVFLSPFVGRLDDVNQSGLSLVENIQKMYAYTDKHVRILAASLRDLDSFVYLLEKEVDIITAPADILRQWADAGKPEALSDEAREKLLAAHPAIVYEGINLGRGTNSYKISHELTTKGLCRFADDWNAMVSK